MARIAGINVPDNKRVEIALTAIYGIGRSSATAITKQFNIDANRKMKDLSERELTMIREYLEKGTLMIEGDLRRARSQDIKILKDIEAYRGIRHKRNLPVRGQRTRTNARSKRGKRVTVGSGRIKLQKT